MDAERLHLLCYFIDFDAYRKLGASLTGATYVAGAKGPEVADVPSSWWRSFVRSKTPWWARALAVPVVLYVLASAGKDDA
jgi:hypothetical protein